MVVANPPYMGSSNMNKWLTAWVKSKYKEVYRDLCTCFIKRGMSLAEDKGYEALITSDTCMYISSFERMRKMVIDRTTIVTFIDTRGTNAHPDVFDANAGWVLWNHHGENVLGAYFKLNHPIAEKGERLLEALAKPDCGWFYRCDQKSFTRIPGDPIAYWASSSAINAFDSFSPLEQFATPRQGLATSNNNRFLRKWWEVSRSNTCRTCKSHEDALASGSRWFPIIRGGSFRKWYGVYDEVVDWLDNGSEMKKEVLRKYPYLNTPDFVIKNQADYFKPAVTWSKISSGVVSFRFAPEGMLFEVAGACMFADESTLESVQGLCNSSVALQLLSFLAPTLNYEVGQIGLIPFSEEIRIKSLTINAIVSELRSLSEKEIGQFETTWDFKRHPLA